VTARESRGADIAISGLTLGLPVTCYRHARALRRRAGPGLDPGAASPWSTQRARRTACWLAWQSPRFGRTRRGEQLASIVAAIDDVL